MIPGLLPFPEIDPVLIHIWGAVAIRWYALSYIAGLMFGWWAAARMTRERGLWRNPTFANKAPITADQVGDLVVWATFGVILGGRIGWILFYGIALCSVSPQSVMCHPAGAPALPMGFLSDPIQLVTIWKGGMSFHGGLAGVALAVWLFCRRHKLQLLPVADMLAVVAPIGLFFGRIANFINGELWGKVSHVPWAMVFCNQYLREHTGCPAGLEPRHPSQLYEAALEGIVLFVLLQFALRRLKFNERPGLLTGLFFLGYGAFRFFVEFFREPDGPFLGWFSMGMALSIPLWAAAGAFLWIALRRHVNGRA
ncbi:MAG TPA: prolipoprotein diacylglyceryl transferase [Rhizomicrobium sp.]|jgi:phosphatidylglycerol:prolipoprotein diacylglycerol transferase|nr:prolipoprotein diacylglyceryl transferase [Rhizomicrobium sp.]